MQDVQSINSGSRAVLSYVGQNGTKCFFMVEVIEPCLLEEQEWYLIKAPKMVFDIIGHVVPFTYHPSNSLDGAFEIGLVSRQNLSLPSDCIVNSNQEIL